MKFRNHISNLGMKIEKLRLKKRIEIKSRSDLVSQVKKVPGLYWIETNMPIPNIISAVASCSRVNKTIRKTTPTGIGFTRSINGFQIIYSGTEDNIQKRLLEHLFNEGSTGTTKMSLKIDCPLFFEYKWFISYIHIKDYPTRYALESWWRLNIGWPPFCIR